MPIKSPATKTVYPMIKDLISVCLCMRKYILYKACIFLLRNEGQALVHVLSQGEGHHSWEEEIWPKEMLSEEREPSWMVFTNHHPDVGFFYRRWKAVSKVAISEQSVRYKSVIMPREKAKMATLLIRVSRTQNWFCVCLQASSWEPLAQNSQILLTSHQRKKWGGAIESFSCEVVLRFQA